MRSEQKHAFDKDGFPRNNEEISLLNQIDSLNERVASQSQELAKTKEELRIVEEEFKKLQDGVVSLIQKAHRDKAQVKVIYLEKLIAE